MTTPTFPDLRPQPETRLRRVLNRATDMAQATLAAQYVARGYFPDAASAMHFLKRVDVREEVRLPRALWRLFRGPIPASPRAR